MGDIFPILRKKILQEKIRVSTSCGYVSSTKKKRLRKQNHVLSLA